MTIMPNHPPTSVLPKRLGTLLFWVPLIAGAVLLWQLAPAQNGSLASRSLVILIEVPTIFAVWALGWLVFLRIKRHRDGAGRSGPSYPMNRRIG